MRGWIPLVFGLLCLPSGATSRPGDALGLDFPNQEVDVVGAPERSGRPRKASTDTLWLAEWFFDGPGWSCDAAGWERDDNRIRNDGSIHWSLTQRFHGQGNIQGTAAAVSGQSPCWFEDGYCNDWYQGIRILYGAHEAPSLRSNAAQPGRDGKRLEPPPSPETVAYLAFDYLLDSEPDYDFLRVEVDSACASFDRVDYTLAPAVGAQSHRSLLFSTSGLQENGRIDSLALGDFAAPDETHCVYIAFFTDEGYAPCDGQLPNGLGAGLVIDNVKLSFLDGLVVTEDFEGDLHSTFSFVNLHDSEPFGTWGRLFRHVTDNDFCLENTGCSWLWTDDTTPTQANHPSMAFGPGGFVVRSWLDEVLLSPWVSLVAPAGASAPFLETRIFGGNSFTTSRIVLHRGARSRKRVGSEWCVSPWQGSWSGGSSFQWTTWIKGFYDLDPEAEEIQIRYRVSDYQLVAGYAPPEVYIPGPGPYVGRTRIGRVAPRGPRFYGCCSPVYWAQDTFASELHPDIPLSVGEHFRPTRDRFGTADFSMGADVIRFSDHSVIGDSIVMHITDDRDAGGITSVDWYGAIVAGPHAGKSPPPWNVGPHGFFQVPAQFSYGSPLPVHDGTFFVDLDDWYFRGGDVVYYFWLAEDAQGGTTSNPEGLHGVPGSIAEAEAGTGGLFEVSYLPTITWDPRYLNRIAAAPHGKIEPTAEEIAASSQTHRLLYTQLVNPIRRSGDANRTSFMYTLDQLGYRGHYDVFDQNGGVTVYARNFPGGRATVEQAQGYALIVYDAGDREYVMPDGIQRWEGPPVDQAGWFRDWLAQAPLGEAGRATLWVIGANALEEHPDLPLYNADMGVLFQNRDQGLDLNPSVVGLGTFQFTSPQNGSSADFTSSHFGLHGGCGSLQMRYTYLTDAWGQYPRLRHYDALEATGTAVTTHRYQDPRTEALGPATIIMNANPTAGWNTILQAHPWFDIVDLDGNPRGQRSRSQLAKQILESALPDGDLQQPDPTDMGETGQHTPAPLQTTLFPNVPNPFNPATTIRFDLARAGHVQLRVYDITGSQVRTLVDEFLQADHHQCRWDGRDNHGWLLPSGIYLLRLHTESNLSTHKMVLLR